MRQTAYVLLLISAVSADFGVFQREALNEDCVTYRADFRGSVYLNQPADGIRECIEQCDSDSRCKQVGNRV